MYICPITLCCKLPVIITLWFLLFSFSLLYWLPGFSNLSVFQGFWACKYWQDFHYFRDYEDCQQWIHQQDCYILLYIYIPWIWQCLHCWLCRIYCSWQRHCRIRLCQELYFLFDTNNGVNFNKTNESYKNIGVHCICLCTLYNISCISSLYLPLTLYSYSYSIYYANIMLHYGPSYFMQWMVRCLSGTHIGLMRECLLIPKMKMMHACTPALMTVHTLSLCQTKHEVCWFW